MQLIVDKINKSFGQNHVLKDLSFTARSGVAMGLLGRNGSGKTTTIRTIMNIFPADSGTVTIDGKPSGEFKKKIGYLPEERGLYPKRLISEQMAYIGELRGMRHREARDRGLQLLRRLEAEEYFDRQLDTLSKGNQQKIQLAIALITDPDIVILDEPFSGLDPVNAQILKRVVEELVREGKMVLFSSHQMGYVEEFCDDICLINKGEIVLAGELVEIKRAYPRDKVLILPEVPGSQALQQQLLQLDKVANMASSVDTVNGRGCMVTLKDAADKNALFAAVLGARIGVDTFQVVEPSLEEIFVERVGEQNEAV